MTDAERQRLSRERRKNGRRVFRLELSEVPIEQLLLALRYRFNADDPEDVGRALQEFLRFLSGDRHV
jgi:hypothetical protein